MSEPKPIPFVMQGSNITLVINNESFTVSADSHINYDKIVDALKAKDWDAIPTLVDTVESITNYGDGKLVIKDGEMFWDGRPFHNSLGRRLIQMHESGFPIEPMVAFTENLAKNPSYRSVEGLYEFLEKNNLPITPDGCFLAYKKVRVTEDRQNLVDIYTRTISNNVGEVVTVNRNEVNDDPNHTCAKGLHVCSIEYLTHYGNMDDPIVMVKVNPADVVAVPYDYNKSKMRVCKYVVEGIHGDVNDEGWDFINRYSEEPVQDFTENETDSSYEDQFGADDLEEMTGEVQKTFDFGEDVCDNNVTFSKDSGKGNDALDDSGA